MHQSIKKHFYKSYEIHKVHVSGVIIAKLDL